MATKTYGLPAGSGPEQLVLFTGTVGGQTGDWEPVTTVDSSGKEVFPALVGTYDYDTGTAKTISVPSGARVLSIAAHATSPGTVQIGASKGLIPVTAATGFSATPGGSLVGPVAIAFAGTDSCFVDWVL